MLKIKDGPSKDFRPISWDPRTCYLMQGLCRWARIKVFEMGSLPWIAWVAQCNNHGHSKGEAGGAEPEAMGRWKQKAC